mmetsp:Transcript_42556/g.108125  ORF Transcript_42556/g.108125 Transcript_42556/m.108125 type:complete len:222 (-) Transcript_42556:120-785(-)
MAPRAPLLATCIAAAGVIGTVHLLAGERQAEVSFVTPNLRGEAAAALAAAVLVGSLAMPAPASAGLKYSVFGFGEGTSDAYNQIDADQPNPYNVFSNPKDKIYVQDNPEYIAKKKASCDESFKRLQELPPLIKTRQAENVKSLLTLQLGSLRSNMEYITANGSPGYGDYDQSGPKWVKANKFFQKIVDVKVAAESKTFDLAADEYPKAMAALAEWKAAVKY